MDTKVPEKFLKPYDPKATEAAIYKQWEESGDFNPDNLPGADHAGFETQVVYEKVLEKEGRSRFQMPPEQLYKEILDFTLKNKSFMEGQLRQLGASCDWSRELFTLA